MPTDPTDPLAKQNLKDRYHGVNDPVAEKMMRRVDGITFIKFFSSLSSPFISCNSIS